MTHNLWLIFSHKMPSIVQTQVGNSLKMLKTEITASQLEFQSNATSAKWKSNSQLIIFMAIWTKIIMDKQLLRLIWTMQEKVRNRKACVAINRDGSTDPNRDRSCYQSGQSLFLDWPGLKKKLVKGWNQGQGKIMAGMKKGPGENMGEGKIAG